MVVAELVIEQGKTNLEKQQFMDYLYVSKILQVMQPSRCPPLENAVYRLKCGVM